MKLPYRLWSSICVLVYAMAIGLGNGTVSAYQPNEKYLQWSAPVDSQRIHGICMVVHGLNLDPDRMQSICHVLREAGMHVLMVSLQGHGENYQPHNGLTSAEARLRSFQQVTLEQWRSEVKKAYESAVQRSREHAVPLYYIGFSLGGVLGPGLLVSDKEVQFDKMVLFAPALRIRSYCHVLKLLSPFPGMVVPSRSAEGYRSNPGTPIAAYMAMFTAIREFRRQVHRTADIPTLVFLDQDDEFVPYSGIENFINRYGLHQWELLPVEKDTGLNGEWKHHLIIDEQVVGLTGWQRIVERMIEHLRTE